MRVLLGCDRVVSPWVRQRLPEAGVEFGPHTTMGVVNRDGHLIAGLIFRNYTGHDIILDIAAESPRWCTKGILATIFQYVFLQLDCQRCTAMQPASHERAHRLVEGVGFTKEGTLRIGWDGAQDMWVYGMLRTECRWIKGLTDGQE